MSSSERADQPEEKSLVPVTIAQAFHHLLYIGLYVAEDKGFFADNGLDVSIETAGGDAQAFSALTSGKAHFAQADPAFVAIAHEKGWEGRVVAMAVDRVALWGVAFDRNLQPFKEAKGFKGLSVATYPEPNTSYVVQKELALSAGLELGKDTHIVQVPFGSELAALEKGRVQIAQTVEPNVSEVELRGGKAVFSYPDAWGPLAFTGLMTSKALIDAQPELIDKAVRSYVKAFAYIHENFEGALSVAEKELPNIDKDVLRKALKRLIDSHCLPQVPRVTEQSWLSLLRIRLDVGDLKALPDEMLYNNRFVDNASLSL